MDRSSDVCPHILCIIFHRLKSLRCLFLCDSLDIEITVKLLGQSPALKQLDLKDLKNRVKIVKK